MLLRDSWFFQCWQTDRQTDKALQLPLRRDVKALYKQHCSAEGALLDPNESFRNLPSPVVPAASWRWTCLIVTSCGSVCGCLYVGAKYRLQFTPSPFGKVKCTSHVASPNITEVLPIAGTNEPIGYFTYLLTHSTQQSLSWEANRFLAVKKFPAFYGTRSFITAFTSVRHLFLS
jgi:hypothetical protein